MTKLVGVTGGIGAGKSIVCQILRAKGYPVYDCDSRAKAIMDQDAFIHEQLCSQIHPLVVVDSVINRRLLSEIVFNDADALKRLNSIVHTAVEEDVARWAKNLFSPIAFVESAILYKCRLAEMVDAVLEVVAPVEMRIARVMTRSALNRQEVESRISSQLSPERRHSRTYYIMNDNAEPILPQLEKILQEF